MGRPCRTGRNFAAAIGLFVLLAVQAWFPGGLVAETVSVGTITAERLNLRSGPSRDSEPVLVLNHGETVRVLDEKSGWLKVRYRNATGYIRNRARYVVVRAVQRPDPEEGRRTAVRTPAPPPPMPEPTPDAPERPPSPPEKGADAPVVTEKERTILQGLNDIDLTLNQTRKRAAALRFEIAEIDERMRRAVAGIETLKERIASLEETAKKRFVALYKLSRVGTLPILAAAGSVQDLIERKAALQRILEYDEMVLRRLSEDKAELDAFVEELAASKKEKEELRARYADHVRAITVKREKRDQIIEDIKTRKPLARAAAETFKEAARQLDEKTQAFNRATLSKPAPEKAPEKGFESFRGSLIRPVPGKVVSGFGEHRSTRFNILNFRSGIDFAADRGEPIRSVADGRVLFADWFKGYGNMIIIDHGESYYTLYAHAEELFKTEGETVRAGEVIATVGDTGSLSGPRLHFEVRHHGKPMNPSAWLAKK